MINKISSMALILVGVITQIGCSGSPPPASLLAPSPAANGGSPGDHRHGFCMFKSDQDSDVTHDAFLKDLSGTWTHQRTDSDPARMQRQEFALDLNRDDASITTYNNDPMDQKDVQDITFGRACVSKPLTGGEFDGFRLVEFMSNDNSGGVALLMKIDPPMDEHSQPVLLMSGYYYQRWADGNEAQDLDNLLSDNGVQTITAYTDRR